MRARLCVYLRERACTRVCAGVSVRACERACQCLWAPLRGLLASVCVEDVPVLNAHVELESLANITSEKLLGTLTTDLDSNS